MARLSLRVSVWQVAHYLAAEGTKAVREKRPIQHQMWSDFGSVSWLRPLLTPEFLHSLPPTSSPAPFVPSQQSAESTVLSLPYYCLQVSSLEIQFDQVPPAWNRNAFPTNKVKTPPLANTSGSCGFYLHYEVFFFFCPSPTLKLKPVFTVRVSLCVCVCVFEWPCQDSAHWCLSELSPPPKGHIAPPTSNLPLSTSKADKPASAELEQQRGLDANPSLGSLIWRPWPEHVCLGHTCLWAEEANT